MVTGSDGHIKHTLDGSKRDKKAGSGSGVVYTDVSAGSDTAYLLRADGKVDRTTGSGKITQVITPLTKEEFDKQSFDAVGTMGKVVGGIADFLF